MEISGAQITILLSVLGAGGAAIMALIKLGRIAGRFEHIGEQQAREIKELKEATSGLAKIIVDLALQHQRQDNIDERQNKMEEDLKALRKGEGWILPHEMIKKLNRMED